MTSTTPTLHDVWHLFQIRKSLLTTRYLGFVFDVNASMHLAEAQQATSSLLYINLVSVLDDAMATQMSPSDFERLRAVHARIVHLRDAGKVVAAEELLRIKDRRNTLGHEVDHPATAEELEAACTVVQRQLAAWGLIPEDEPGYTLTYQRLRAPDSPDPKIAFVLDHFIRIVRGVDCVCEWRRTINHYRIGASPSETAE